MSQMTAAAPQSSNASRLQRINVSIANRQRVRAVDSHLLRRIVKTLLSELLQAGHADVGIHLVAALEMTRLNETFLHHAGSTDVITFDYADHASRMDSEAFRSTKHAPSLHGEIFICVDEAVSHARHFRTRWQSELVRYIVHGLLHLLGLDDRRAAARRKMKSEESRLLGRLSLRFPMNKLARPVRGKVTAKHD